MVNTSQASEKIIVELDKRELYQCLAAILYYAERFDRQGPIYQEYMTLYDWIGQQSPGQQRCSDTATDV